MTLQCFFCRLNMRLIKIFSQGKFGFSQGYTGRDKHEFKIY